MTYSAEVLADSPVLYLHLDETSGTTPANSGSLGGTATMGASVLINQASTPGTIGGKSIYATNAQTTTAYGVTKSSVTMTADWTYEVWYRHDTGFTNSENKALGGFMTSTSNYFALRINQSTSAFTVTDTTGGTSATITATGVMDGSWHHIAVTKSGTTFTLYVDGVSKGTTTLTVATRTTPTFILGYEPFTSGSLAGWADEPAFYTSVLSSTRIAAHYSAGVQPATFGVTVRPPAATASLSAPNAKSHATRVAPAMALSLTAVNPASAAVNYQFRYAATEDRLMGATGTGGNDGAQVNASFMNLYPSGSINRSFLVKFADITIPTNKTINPASIFLRFADISGASTGILRVTRVTSTWGEATADPTFTTAGSVDYSFSTSGGVGTATIDISTIGAAWASGQPYYGVRVEYVSGTGGGISVSTSEKSTVADRPYLDITYVPIPDVAITVSAPAMAVSLAAPAPVVTAQRKINAAVPAATLSLSAVVPSDVKAGRSIRIVVTKATINASMPGGHLVNHLTYADAMEIALTSQNSQIRFPRVNTVDGAMGLSVDLDDNVHINLQTSRLVKTTPIGGEFKMVGIYQKEQDRYFKILPSTLDTDDIWYEMEDKNNPTVLHDSTYSTLTGGQKVKAQDGKYVGTPVFGVDGPQLRKAVAFDGGTDYLWLANTVLGVSGYGAQSGNPTELVPGMAVTIEFSINTTQRDGTLWVGGGYNNYNSTAMAQHGGQPIQFRLEDGMIVAYNRGEYQFTVRKDIADGEWHHVILSVPVADSALNYTVQRQDGGAHPTFGQPRFVNIDGVTEWASYGFDGAKLQGAEVLPYTFLAKTTLGVTPQNPTDVLAASLRDVIIRLNYAVGQTVAQKLYYEWSDSKVIDPPAMTVNASFKSPFKIRGNVKRMLMVYGNQWGTTWDNNDRTPDRPVFTYFSNLAGFFIDTFANYVDTPTGYRQGDHVEAHIGTTLFGGQVYYEPKTFMLEGYLVYPVSIVGDTSHPRAKANNTGPISAAGMITDNPRDKSYGRLDDEHTGLPRFINLQEDLLEPITNFDVITVVNYPWATADDEDDRTNLDDSAAGGQNQGARLYQNSMGLTPTEWTQNRDRFRDSILEAAYNGVNLWIPEYHMAHHLGFISGYDVHNPKWFLTTDADDNSRNVLKWQNLAAQEIDRAHLLDGISDTDWVGSQGDYYSYPQALYYRRIVATEPGLTDVPGNEYNNYLERYSYDPWKVNGGATMYDVLKRPDGLQVGDLTAMSMFQWKPGRPAQLHEQYLRSEVISAKPEGIAGKVIAREQQFYYKGGSTTPVPNPYANNAVTIAAERGTVVRGRPIEGRAFMEFMDTSIYQTNIPVDHDKNLWHGDRNTVSSFDFDTRRYREVVSTINTDTDGNEVKKVRFNKLTQSFAIFTLTQRFFEYQMGNYDYLVYTPMHVRGLLWLAQTSDVPAGQNTVYAPAMEVTIAAPDTGLSLTRNLVNTVNGAMRIVAELRTLGNFKDGNVRERSFTIALDLVMRGTGKRIKNIDPMVLSLESLTPARALGSGDRIAVYLDGDREITLFLKEDN